MSEHQIIRGMELEPFRAGGVSQAEVEQYALVSGDGNPIHTDPKLANKAGLDDLPVQGMFVMAMVATYLENWSFCQHINDLNIRFVKPTLINRDIIFSARVVSVSQDQGQSILRITVHQDDQMVAMGEADVLCPMLSIGATPT